jgi:hypothetical protein
VKRIDEIKSKIIRAIKQPPPGPVFSYTPSWLKGGPRPWYHASREPMRSTATWARGDRGGPGGWLDRRR